jgi:hypothetical protein
LPIGLKFQGFIAGTHSTSSVVLAAVTSAGFDRVPMGCNTLPETENYDGAPFKWSGSTALLVDDHRF